MPRTCTYTNRVSSLKEMKAFFNHYKQFYFLQILWLSVMDLCLKSQRRWCHLFLNNNKYTTLIEKTLRESER